MKKILILGSSELQIPAIKTAKDMGLYVVCVDINPEAPGKIYCDAFYQVSTNDKERVYEVAKEEQINAIFTMATDRPMTTLTYVANKLGLVSNSEEATINTTNKAHMRSALDRAKISIPKFEIISNYDDFLDKVSKFKTCIVKSSDNSGKKGIYVIDDTTNRNDLEYAFQYSMSNSLNKTILIEEIVKGPEVSVEAITFNGVTEIIAITDKINTGQPRYVEMSHVQPSSLSNDVIERINQETKNTIKSLGITNGASHTELIIQDNRPYIIEIGGRLGGDYITSHITKLSTGYDIVKASINISLGIKPEKFENINKFSMVKYLEEKVGIISKIKVEPNIYNIKGVDSVNIFKNKGDTIKTYENSSDRIGCIIVSGDSYKELEKTYNEAINYIEIEVVK